jgi:hypothetical protein
MHTSQERYSIQTSECEKLREIETIHTWLNIAAKYHYAHNSTPLAATRINDNNSNLFNEGRHKIRHHSQTPYLREQYGSHPLRQYDKTRTYRRNIQYNRRCS